VKTEVGSVKTEVGSVRSDVDTARSNIEVAKTELQRMRGDLGLMSGLVATNGKEIQTLRDLGDRNIYEFTLSKGHRQPVSTVSLELKKVDRKKGKFTLNVVADDRTIEKKDRTLYEPMQFYTGRDKMLYEVVVMSVDKDKISGYLSAPKNAPQPISK
jgi:hypothetical protein